MTAVAIVVVGALLGGVIQTLNAAVDRQREGRAAARVVGTTLAEALVSLKGVSPAGGQQRRRSQQVVADYATYLAVWESERTALARA